MFARATAHRSRVLFHESRFEKVLQVPIVGACAVSSPDTSWPRYSAATLHNLC